MGSEQTIYAVQIPMIGQPDNRYTLCRCLTVDSAIEVARVLLAAKDPEVHEVCVIVTKQLSP